MNKRPGQVTVTTEVAFCSFCARPRTLRLEQRQLGTLVRTVTTCETCHRTLSSTIGVASAEPADGEQVADVKVPAADVAAEPAKKSAPAKPAAPAKRITKSAAAKPKASTSRKTTKSK